MIYTDEKVTYPFIGNIPDGARKFCQAVRSIRVYARDVDPNEGEDLFFLSDSARDLYAVFENTQVSSGYFTATVSWGFGTVEIASVDLTASIEDGYVSVEMVGTYGNIRATLDMAWDPRYMTEAEGDEAALLQVDLPCLVLNLASPCAVAAYNSMAYRQTDEQERIRVFMREDFEILSGYNMSVKSTVTTVSVTAYPGAGEGRYSSDPWSGTYIGPFAGIRTINGLSADHNVVIEASELVTASFGAVTVTPGA